MKDKKELLIAEQNAREKLEEARIAENKAYQGMRSAIAPTERQLKTLELAKLEEIENPTQEILDKKCRLILESYYFPHVLKEGTKVELAEEFSRGEDPDRDYIEAIVTDESGHSKSYGYNYRVDEDGKSLLIFRKTFENKLVKPSDPARYVIYAADGVTERESISLEWLARRLEDEEIIQVDDQYFQKAKDETGKIREGDTTQIIEEESVGNMKKTIGGHEEIKYSIGKIGQLVCARKADVTTTTVATRTFKSDGPIYETAEAARAAAAGEMKAGETNIKTEITMEGTSVAEFDFLPAFTTNVDLTGLSRKFGRGIEGYDPDESDEENLRMNLAKPIREYLEKSGFHVLDITCENIETEAKENVGFMNTVRSFQITSGTVCVTYMKRLTAMVNVKQGFLGRNQSNDPATILAQLPEGSELLDPDNIDWKSSKTEVGYVVRNHATGTGSAKNIAEADDKAAENAIFEAQKMIAKTLNGGIASGIRESIGGSGAVSTVASARAKLNTPSVTKNNMKLTHKDSKYAYSGSCDTQVSLVENKLVSVTTWNGNLLSYVPETEPVYDKGIPTDDNYDRYVNEKDESAILIFEKTNSGLRRYVDEVKDARNHSKIYCDMYVKAREGLRVAQAEFDEVMDVRLATVDMSGDETDEETLEEEQRAEAAAAEQNVEAEADEETVEAETAEEEIEEAEAEVEVEPAEEAAEEAEAEAEAETAEEEVEGAEAEAEVETAEEAAEEAEAEAEVETAEEVAEEAEAEAEVETTEEEIEEAEAEAEVETTEEEIEEAEAEVEAETSEEVAEEPGEMSAQEALAAIFGDVPTEEPAKEEPPIIDPFAMPTEEPVKAEPPIIDPFAMPTEEPVKAEPPIIDPFAMPVEEPVKAEPPIIDPFAMPVEEPAKEELPIIDPFAMPVEEPVKEELPIIDPFAMPVEEPAKEELPIIDPFAMPAEAPAEESGEMSAQEALAAIFGDVPTEEPVKAELPIIDPFAMPAEEPAKAEPPIIDPFAMPAEEPAKAEPPIIDPFAMPAEEPAKAEPPIIDPFAMPTEEPAKEELPIIDPFAMPTEEPAKVEPPIIDPFAMPAEEPAQEEAPAFDPFAKRKKESAKTELPIIDPFAAPTETPAEGTGEMSPQEALAAIFGDVPAEEPAKEEPPIIDPFAMPAEEPAKAEPPIIDPFATPSEPAKAEIPIIDPFAPQSDNQYLVDTPLEVPEKQEFAKPGYERPDKHDIPIIDPFAPKQETQYLVDAPLEVPEKQEFAMPGYEKPDKHELPIIDPFGQQQENQYLVDAPLEVPEKQEFAMPGYEKPDKHELPIIDPFGQPQENQYLVDAPLEVPEKQEFAMPGYEKPDKHEKPNKREIPIIDPFAAPAGTSTIPDYPVSSENETPATGGGVDAQAARDALAAIFGDN